MRGLPALPSSSLPSGLEVLSRMVGFGEEDGGVGGMGFRFRFGECVAGEGEGISVVILVA